MSLGFIDTYTLIPPRGAIITGKKKTWLTTRDLQTAFISARLPLTEPQLILLRSLVHSFASQQSETRATTSSSENAVSALTASAELTMPVHNESTKKQLAVLGPAHTLSADWLKKYLVHLRLTKKTCSSSATSAGAGAALSSTSSMQHRHSSAGLRSSSVPDGVRVSPTSPEVGEGADKPLLFRDWLGRKLEREEKRVTDMPKDFEKALGGQPHPLSREDIELMLRTYNVLPADILQQEVECRIESWLLDMVRRRL